MNIRAQDVNAARALAVWVMRALAAACLGFGAYLILKAVLLGISVSNMEMAYSVYSNVGDYHPLSRGLALMAAGATLAFAAPAVARWVVAVPPRGCPGCGYAGPGRDGLCPECGLRID